MKGVYQLVLATIFSAVVGISGVAYAQKIDNPAGGSSQGGANAINNATSGKGSILIPDCIRLAENARTKGLSCLTDSITFYTNLLLYVVAVAALGYMLYGSFLYATAFGDESKIGRAKKTITYAIIGIILSGSALLIVQLVRTILKA